MVPLVAPSLTVAVVDSPHRMHIVYSALAKLGRGVVRGGDEPRHAASARDAPGRRDRGRARRRRGPLRPLFRRPRPGTCRDRRASPRPRPPGGTAAGTGGRLSSRSTDRPVGDVARLRLREAGADHLADLDGLCRPGALRALVNGGPSTSWHPSPASTSRRHGLRLSSRVNAGLAYLLGEGVATYFEDGASSDLGLSRRRSITVHALRRAGRPRPCPHGFGGRAGIRHPSWRQIARLVRVAVHADG